MPTHPTLGNWIALITLGLLWGASFLGVALALQAFGPLTVAAGRITLALVALVAVALVLRLRLPGLRAPQERRIWGFALAMGLLSNALPFFLLAWAQQHVTSGFAGVSMAAIPLFVMGLAHFLIPGEAMTRLKVAGFALGLIGVMVLIGPGALARSGAAAEPLARVLCFAAAASYACGAIVTRRCPQVHPLAFSVIALLAASAMILPVALWVEGVPALPAEATPLLALVYLGLGSTAAATLLLVGVIRSAGPSFLSQVNYHVPVWSVLLGAVVLGEVLPPQFLLAAGLILGGLALSRFRGRRALA
ncbi:DMT family transporter [Rhodobacteraceae bacterium 2376]|uniref:DMT family transporter n=1 Tax=Rhabdonatronobacter sediminivivens TaxID=2743469 RepID=A0A7Z0KXS6_9RHOB|nr:DMT family transporter [Rhabdonatronobacter sediminivivens]NYS25087.1 DMT family transporter [Rhabdonatronobacter sediminivivens]